jgi:predicted DsbA family dithiol-disulfide isomerase
MKNLFILLLTIIFTACSPLNNSEIKNNPENPEKKAETSNNTNKKTTATIITNQISPQIETLQNNLKKLGNIKIKILEKKEAENLIKENKISLLPQVLLSEEAENLEIIKPFFNEVTKKTKDGYLLNVEALGINIGSKYVINSFDITDDMYYTKGDKNALIEIIEISDFECPYCKKFHNETMPKILEEYGDKVSFRFMHLPLDFHPDAKNAARAFLCAKDNKKEIYNKLFETENLKQENLIKIAQELKLDEKEFKECLVSNNNDKIIKTHTKKASSLNINGTPSFLINKNILISGAYPFEFFKEIIDTELLSSKSL